MNDETIMSAEEFFGELEKGKAPAHTGKALGKRTRKDLFAELKIKMVMRIYGLSRAHAAKFVALREGEIRAEAARKAKEKPAEEFPGIEDLLGSR